MGVVNGMHFQSCFYHLSILHDKLCCAHYRVYNIIFFHSLHILRCLVNYNIKKLILTDTLSVTRTKC